MGGSGDGCIVLRKREEGGVGWLVGWLTVDDERRTEDRVSE